MRNILRHATGTRGIASEAGVGIIEYIMIVGLIAVTTLSTVTLLGKNLAVMLDFISVHMRAWLF